MKSVYFVHSRLWANIYNWLYATFYKHMAKYPEISGIACTKYAYFQINLVNGKTITFYNMGARII